MRDEAVRLVTERAQDVRLVTRACARRAPR